MSGTTSVPPPTFGPTGFSAPAESAVLAGVTADLNAAFGGNLNPDETTAQGQIASTETAIIGDKNNKFLLLANSVDPAFAQGRYQDAIGRIYFLTRIAAQSTVVNCTVSGLVGLKIPAGTRALALDGNYYVSTADGTIAPGGTTVIPFACVTTGPVSCPAGTLVQIASDISGWDTITNAQDGIVGRNVESRYDFEYRRALSVAANGMGTIPAIQGSVLGVAGVLDAYVTDNTSAASPITIDGVTVPPGGLYVCVAGGVAADVAMAIWKKKQPGGPYASGNTTVTVSDPSPSYGASAPTYAVTYQNAAAETLVMKVTLKNSLLVPSNATALIQAAVLSAFSGADGGPRARIGQMVFASRFIVPVAAIGTWVQIESLKLGTSTSPDASFTASVSGATMTVSGTVTGTIAIGATVLGANIPDGTTILSGSGTTWTLSAGLGTIASESMVSVTPTSDFVTVGAAHIPALAAGNIKVAVA